MRILVSGASGLVGSRLVVRLRELGHEVHCLVRRTAREYEIRWYPDQGVIHENLLEGFEGVVNLSGESIASGRWSAAKKERILKSRVESTFLLCKSLTRVSPMPKVLVSASAIGYYGDCGERRLEENASPGHDFLADVCQQWESATGEAIKAGIRVVNLRIGIVISRLGGALSKMLTPFRLGVGGVLGNGKQYWSWITREDLVSSIVFCLTAPALSGPVNAVAPEAVTNRQFTRSLGRVLRRPTLLPMPGFAAMILWGEMADALMLTSTRVIPRKLIDAGFPFQHGELDPALRYAIAESTS